MSIGRIVLKVDGRARSDWSPSSICVTLFWILKASRVKYYFSPGEHTSVALQGFLLSCFFSYCAVNEVITVQEAIMNEAIILHV